MNFSLKNKSALLALFFSACALIISLLSLNFIVGIRGKVKIYKPSGFAIMRNNPSRFFKPNDNVLLPLEWQNTSGRDLHISEPYLKLREIIKEDGKETEAGIEYIFLLAGEFSDLNLECLKREYSITNSFILPKLSITKNILLFHIQHWWNKNLKEQGYDFRFVYGKRYKVFLGYKLNLEKQPEIYLFEMWIDRSLPKDNLQDSDQWVEFWYLSDHLYH